MTSLNHSELANDERFLHNQQRLANRSILSEILQSIIVHLPSREILTMMNNQNVPCAEVKSIDAVFSDQSAQSLILEENINGINTKRVRTTAFKFPHD